MKPEQCFSLKLMMGCAWLLVFLGAGCQASSASSDPGSGTGGADPGAGGSPGSGGSSAGSGGVPGSGGSGVAASGGSSGNGGTTGAGGVTSTSDAGSADAAIRDARMGADRRVSGDTPVDAPPTAQDANISTGGDGGCVPDYACQPVAPNTGDPYADCVERVNQFRACVCLPPLARWTAGEACADQDAEYDSEQGTAHAGAQANICDWGNAQDECPDWKRSTAASVIDGCLQMMFEEGPPPSGSCTGQCYSDHGHYINMTGTNYKSGVACGFYTTSTGSVWATQNFR
jgi:hypothetical protein